MKTSPEPRQQQVTLDDVLITDALALRPARAPRLQAENAALHLLARQMATQPDVLLNTLVELAVDLCQADTAGLSLLETATDSEEFFRWAVMAGELASAVGGTTPRDFSPCGTTLDRHAAQLFAQPGRYFSYFDAVPVPIWEGLVIPFYAGERPLGTLWVVSHREDRQFDWEDARLLTSLANFCAAALTLATLAADNARLYKAEYEARTLAQTALAQQDALLSSISHDLKSPLTTLLGTTQLMLRRATRTTPTTLANTRQAARLGAGLTTIEQAVIQLAGMVNELVDLSQLQSGQKLELHRAPMDLVPLLRCCAESAQRATSRHTIIVQITAETAAETNGKTLVGRWDTSRLERLIMNLLTNAIKFSPAGGTISLALSRELSDSMHLAVLTIADEGLGIPPADLPRIFDRFYRGTNVIGRVAGTGIGLAGARQIAEQHGGTLTATSILGEGSRFSLRLPLL